MENKINYQFKVLYALGIIFVVIGHIANNNVHLFLNNIFPVAGSHLALFVFASVYFYKKEVENIVESLGKKLSGDMLKDMFASDNKNLFAKKLLKPIIEFEVRKRKKYIYQHQNKKSEV